MKTVWQQLAMFATCGGLAGASGATPPAYLAQTIPESNWVFEIIPKAFQRNPRLEMTVMTEVTDAGRKLPAVTPQAPAYYLLHSGGYHQVGVEPVIKRASVIDVESGLQRSLAIRGYLPATPAHPASLLVIYFWGSHTQDLAAGAVLVGGRKFATDLAQAIQEQDLLSLASARPIGRGRDPDGMDLGAAAGFAQMNAIMNPVACFLRRGANNEFLFDQAADNGYYVVASAYDYQSLAANQRRLLWRTRMTVCARGVSQPESLPTLIANASPYFGREMSEAEVMLRRAARTADVQIGDLTVVDHGSPAAPPATPPAGAKRTR